MTTETKTLAQFITENGITMTAMPSSRNPNMEGGKMDHWFCTFRQKDGRAMGVHFSTGLGLRKERNGLPPKKTWEQHQNESNFGSGGSRKQTTNQHKLRADYDAYCNFRMAPVSPTAADVLDCLASDCSGMDSGTTFEDWCSEYGYDTDSRKAEQTFLAVKAEAAQLREFLGDAFSDLLNCERL